MGDRPRGLQRRRQRLGLLLPRPVAFPRLPLGRRRPRRHLRRQAAALFRGRALEREGRHPEGAAVRPHQQRGQSRRGRQGVLLLRRQHADALVHEVPVQVSAARVPLRRSRRDQPAAVARGDGVRAARHRRLRRGSLLRRRRRVRQGRARGRARARHRAQPRAGGGPPARAADVVVPQHVVVGTGRRQAVVARVRPGGDRSHARRARHLHARVRRRTRSALHRERDQHGPAVAAGAGVALGQGRVPRLGGLRQDATR